MILAEACPGTFVALKGACGKTTTTTTIALANSVKNRLFQEKVYYQQKENIMCNYSTKNNEKSAKQFKKRALKINNW